MGSPKKKDTRSLEAVGEQQILDRILPAGCNIKDSRQHYRGRQVGSMTNFSSQYQEGQ